MVGGFLEGRRCCRWRAMEVASFVPGHVQNRGATPRSWTALCSKKNKVATPLGTDPMSVVFDGAHAARSRRGKHRHHPHRPPRFRNRGATPWAWTALCSKKNKVATPFHSNRMERRRHVAPFLGSHAANHASKLKEAEVATANTDRGRAPGLVPACMAATTKRVGPSLPAWRVLVGRAALHSSMLRRRTKKEGFGLSTFCPRNKAARSENSFLLREWGSFFLGTISNLSKS